MAKKGTDEQRDLSAILQRQTESAKAMYKILEDTNQKALPLQKRLAEMIKEKYEGILEVNQDLTKELMDHSREQDIQAKMLATGMSARVAELTIAKERLEIEADLLGFYDEGTRIIIAQYEKAIQQQKQLDKIADTREHEKKLAEEIAEIDEERLAQSKKLEASFKTLKLIITDKRVAMAALVATSMKLGESFSEAYKELKEEGLSATQAAHEAMTSFTDSMSTGFLISGKAIREARAAIMETGGSLRDAEEAGVQAAKMAELYGGSLEVAGKSLGNLQKLPGLSKEAAVSAQEYSYALSEAAGVQQKQLEF